MDNVDITISEPRRGKPVTKIWHLKGLKQPFKYNVLKTQAMCRMELGEIESVPVSVEFFFKECKRTTVDPTNSSRGGSQEMFYLDLYMRTVTHQPRMHFAVDLEVMEMNENRHGGNNGVAPVAFNDYVVCYEKRISEKVCLQYAFLTPFNIAPHQVTRSSPATYIPKDEYKFKITVTPLYSNEDLEVDDNHKKDEGSISHDLGKLLSPSSNENFADLKLETKDNMTLSAHKVLLAARSPYLRTLIEKETTKKDFSGTIKIDTVNAKAMIAILHWIYTGEVPPTAGRVMEEVVDAAIAFKLTGLLKYLDKKLITICNSENMFDLYKVAKANGMTSAIADVSAFITEYLKKF